MLKYILINHCMEDACPFFSTLISAAEIVNDTVTKKNERTDDIDES